MIRVITLIAALLVAFPVFATGDGGPRGGFCNGRENCNTDNSTTTFGGEGGRGGRGGDATAYGGKGGRGGDGYGLGVGIADVEVDNSNTNRNKLINDNWLWTDVRSSNKQHQGQNQGQLQGNVGLGSGNDTKVRTNVTVEGDDVNYEAPKKPDVPAYAPSVSPATATAPCYATWSVNGGWAGLFAAGGGGYKKDHGCALGEVVRRATESSNPAIAEKALNLMLRVVMEEAGIEDEDDSTTAAVASERDYVEGGRDEAFSFQQDWQ